MSHLYRIKEGVTFLNSGSFGKRPLAILEQQQALREELELEPVDFLARKVYSRMANALEALEGFMGAPKGSVVFTSNVTEATNVVAKALCAASSSSSLLLKEEDDEVLTTTHEYGACERAWEWALENRFGSVGAHYRRVGFPLSLRDDPSTCTPEAIAEEFIAQFRPNTRIVFISHITSATALTLPVALICKAARERGIVSVVDGAHALGQLDLDLQAIGADFYVGNCHKWFQAPLGVGFLCTRSEEWQKRVAPLVISWGWRRLDAKYGVGVGDFTGNEYQNAFCWPGTIDPTPPLCIPACIEFMKKHDWPNVRKACFELCRYARAQVQSLTGVTQLYPDSPLFYAQMVLLPLPRHVDARALHNSLWNTHQVEIPGITWEGQPFLRISVQMYTTREDVDCFVRALKTELDKLSLR